MRRRMTDEEFHAHIEATWRESRPRIYALIDAIRLCLFGDGYESHGNRLELEDALIAMGAAANRGCEIPEEDVDHVAGLLLWPSAQEFERRTA